jgi:hypothetical protein
VTGIEPALSAWELDCHASVTETLQVSCQYRLSVSAREIPVLTLGSGTRRARQCLPHLGRVYQLLAGLNVLAIRLGKLLRRLQFYPKLAI